MYIYIYIYIYIDIYHDHAEDRSEFVRSLREEFTDAPAEAPKCPLRERR